MEAEWRDTQGGNEGRGAPPVGNGRERVCASVRAVPVRRGRTHCQLRYPLLLMRPCLLTNHPESINMTRFSLPT